MNAKYHKEEAEKGYMLLNAATKISPIILRLLCVIGFHHRENTATSEKQNTNRT